MFQVEENKKVLLDRIILLEKENKELKVKLRELQEITDSMDKTLELVETFTQSFDKLIK